MKQPLLRDIIIVGGSTMQIISKEIGKGGVEKINFHSKIIQNVFKDSKNLNQGNRFSIQNL
jgi:hypothetical protein